MGIFPLTSIADVLTPMLNKFKLCCSIGISSAFVIAPAPAYSAHISTDHKPIQIHQIRASVVSTEQVSEFHKSTQDIIDFVEISSPILDFCISLIPWSYQYITDNDLKLFNKLLNTYNDLASLMITAMKMHGLKNDKFEQALEIFKTKMTDIYQTIKSSKYKADYDEVVAKRAYKGAESVGYTYNKNHSFEDFKQALLN